MNIMKWASALAALAFIFSAASGATAEPDKRSIAVFDFFLQDRIPRNTLENTVIPVGDNFFSAERFGLQSAMTRVFSAALDDAPGVEVLPLWEREYPDPELEAAFNFYNAGDDPRVFFDAKKMEFATSTAEAQLIVAGVVRELKISKNAKSPNSETVKMKVAIVLYDAEASEFLFFKNYEGDTEKTKAFVDDDALPTRGGRVPRDIRKFADSETGRVFMSLLPGMISDVAAALEPKPVESVEPPKPSGSPASPAP